MLSLLQHSLKQSSACIRNLANGTPPGCDLPSFKACKHLNAPPCALLPPPPTLVSRLLGIVGDAAVIQPLPQLPRFDVLSYNDDPASANALKWIAALTRTIAPLMCATCKQTFPTTDSLHAHLTITRHQAVPPAGGFIRGAVPVIELVASTVSPLHEEQRQVVYDFIETGWNIWLTGQVALAKHGLVVLLQLSRVTHSVKNLCCGSRHQTCKLALLMFQREHCIRHCESEFQTTRTPS